MKCVWLKNSWSEYRKQYGNIPFIIIMDRGYPSTPAFIHMMDKNIKFIVRLKSSDYKKEQNSLTENDQLVKIKLDKSRIRHYEGTIDKGYV